MNLFKDYFTSLLSEMARSRLKTKVASNIAQKGYRRAALTDAQAIRDAKSVFGKGKANAEFQGLATSLQSGNDDIEKATQLFNLINNLPDSELRKTKRKLVNSLIEATNSPYHSFEQVKQFNVLQFKYYNTKEIETKIKKTKLSEKLISNLQQWHGLYFNIARILTKLDILDNPKAFGTTEEQFNSMTEVSKMNFIKPFIVKYFKPKSKTDISMDSEARRNVTQDYGSRDKSVIFFFDNQGEPYRSLVTIDPIESSKYSSLKEKEDNVKLTTPPFQKGGGTMLGVPTPKPFFDYEDEETGVKRTVNRYGPTELVGKTVSQIKEIVGHDAAFEAFKKKYPPNDERYKKALQGSRFK